eukprot:scaffold8447_cov186-Amphora_coffeaeformis.AAC.2
MIRLRELKRCLKKAPLIDTPWLTEEMDAQRTLRNETKFVIVDIPIFIEDGTKSKFSKRLWIRKRTSLSFFFATKSTTQKIKLNNCFSRSTELFCEIDNESLDCSGKTTFGRQWKCFSGRKNIKKVFLVVKDKAKCRDGLSASEFGNFRNVLSYCIRGKEQVASHQMADSSATRTPDSEPAYVANVLEVLILINNSVHFKGSCISPKLSQPKDPGQLDQLQPLTHSFIHPRMDTAVDIPGVIF